MDGGWRDVLEARRQDCLRAAGRVPALGKNFKFVGVRGGGRFDFLGAVALDAAEVVEGAEERAIARRDLGRSRGGAV